MRHQYLALISLLILSWADPSSAQWRDDRFETGLGDSVRTLPYTAPNIYIEAFAGLGVYAGMYYGTSGDKFFSGRSTMYDFLLPSLLGTSFACWYTSELTSHQRGSYLYTLLGTALGQVVGIGLASALGHNAPGILHYLGTAAPTVTLAIVFANGSLSPRREVTEEP